MANARETVIFSPIGPSLVMGQAYLYLARARESSANFYRNRFAPPHDAGFQYRHWEGSRKTLVLLRFVVFRRCEQRVLVRPLADVVQAVDGSEVVHLNGVGDALHFDL
jgi:hypothetical protein